MTRIFCQIMALCARDVGLDIQPSLFPLAATLYCFNLLHLFSVSYRLYRGSYFSVGRFIFGRPKFVAAALSPKLFPLVNFVLRFSWLRLPACLPSATWVFCAYSVLALARVPFPNSNSSQSTARACSERPAGEGPIHIIPHHLMCTYVYHTMKQ